MPSTEPSPRPWRVNGHSIEANDPNGLWLQNEKTGWGVVANLPSCPKSRMSKRNRETWDAIVDTNARLIVDAVNERDRLRDLVRNSVETLEQVYKHADMTDALREVVAEMQREACAALGEGETPTGKGAGA